MRVALYARVSTLNLQHPEMQLAELREYASRRGWKIVGEYVDEGVSGSKESRPELNRLMADVHRRKLDVVLCWKIDRFGRSLKHLVNALADLDAYGVAFVSLKDNLDLSTPSGRLMMSCSNACQCRMRATSAGSKRQPTEAGTLPRNVWRNTTTTSAGPTTEPDHDHIQAGRFLLGGLHHRREALQNPAQGFEQA